MRITLSPRAERALRMVAKVEQTPRTERAKPSTFAEFAALRKLELVAFRIGASGMTWNDLELTAAGREWLKVKLTDTQRDTLMFFAGVASVDRVKRTKTTAATYAKLVALELIEDCDAFPYHRVTTAGLEWLGLPTTCPACCGPRDRHKRDCPVAMHEQAVKIEATAPQAKCSACSKSLLWIHERWIGVDGATTCIGLDSHTPVRA